MKIVKNMLIAATLILVSMSCSFSGSLAGHTIQGSKNYVTKEMKMAPYTQIKLTGSPDVVFTQNSGEPRLKIHTSDNLLDLLDIYVDNQILHIGFKKNVSVSYDKLTIEASSPNLNEVSVTGSGEVRITDGLKTDKLNLNVTGSGDIFANQSTCNQCHLTVTGSGDITLQELSAHTVQAHITGSGDIVLQGKAQEATYEVNGSGDLSASQLHTYHTSAIITGSGDIQCHADKELKAIVTGSGSIGYNGNPKVDTGNKGVYKL